MHIVSSSWLTLRNNSLAGFEIISSHLGKLKNLDLSYNIFNDSHQLFIIELLSKYWPYAFKSWVPSSTSHKCTYCFMIKNQNLECPSSDNSPLPSILSSNPSGKQSSLSSWLFLFLLTTRINWCPEASRPAAIYLCWEEVKFAMLPKQL
jgi:hypothetical protein